MISSIGYNKKNNKFEFLKDKNNFIDEVFFKFKNFHQQGIITDYLLYDKILKKSLKDIDSKPKVLCYKQKVFEPIKSYCS